MTTQQQAKASATANTTASPTALNIDQVTTDDPVELLDDQVTIDPDARGDAYIPIEETNLPVLREDTLEDGLLIYDPRNPEVVYEVRDQYEDDFGKQKIRVEVHSNDYRDGRLNTFFKTHLLRDFTYLGADDDQTEEDVQLSADALTRAWDGSTTDEDETEEDAETVQTTLF